MQVGSLMQTGEDDCAIHQLVGPRGPPRAACPELVEGESNGAPGRGTAEVGDCGQPSQVPSNRYQIIRPQVA